MATNDLTSVIVRALARSFPGADLSRGSSVWAFTIDPILEYAGPTPLDLPTRSFIQSILKTKHPGGELETDTTIDDLFVKPAESILSPMVRDIYNIRRRQTLSDLRSHTLDSITALATNYGVVPGVGGYARGSVRLFYAGPVNDRVVPETYFETTSGLRYFAASIQNVSSSEMSLNMSGDLYYWDVQVVAEKTGSIYNIPPNSIVRSPNLPRTVRVANLFSMTGGSQSASVESVAAELANYPTTRQIGTYRGTKAHLVANYPELRVVEVVGLNDPEMQRDIIRGGEVGDEVAVDPITSMPVQGNAGFGVPDGNSSYRTTWMEEAGMSFVGLFGTSSGEITGFYLLAVWPSGNGPQWAISRITRVLSANRVEVADPVFPVNQVGITWAVVPARLTLSQVPGGILWPDTDDGEVIIRDNEIHVGGQTDVFLLGSSLEQSISSLSALDDEAPLGFGSSASTAINSRSILLTDPGLEVSLLGPATATQHATIPNIYYFAGLPWGVYDFEDISAGQVFYAPALVPSRYRILYVGRDVATGGLQVTLDSTPTGSPASIAGARIVKRSLGVGLGASFQLISGADAGYYKVHQELEGTSTDAVACSYRVITDLTMTATAAGVGWRLSDDIDINLARPKRLRCDGVDLSCLASSEIVTSTTTDFTLFGVTTNDLLVIPSGANAGTYTIMDEPFGAGNRQLRVDRTLPASMLVSYQIYHPESPLQLPLVSVTQVGLVDADGNDLGVDVPYGEPLGAYSSQFANLSAGVKLQDYVSIVGICSTSGVVLGGAAAVWDFNTHPIRLLIWHRKLGFGYGLGTDPAYRPCGIPLETGGLVLPLFYSYPYAGPVSYDLSISGNWTNLLNYLNAPLAYPFFGFEDRAENGVVARYLTIRPFGAMVIALSGVGTRLSTLPTPFSQPMEYTELGTLSLIDGSLSNDSQITTKDVYLGRPASEAYPELALLQDLVDIPEGPNSGVKDLLLQVHSALKPQRIRTRGFRPYSPQIGVLSKVGFPSTGLARTYFQDPTDFEAGPTTRYIVDGDQSLSFWPDPTKNSVLSPGYPSSDVNYDGGYLAAAPTSDFSLFSVGVPSSAAVDMFMEMVHPGDLLEILCRDIITTRNGVGWPAALAAAQTLIISEEGKSPVTINIPAGAYTLATAISTINAGYGQEIAFIGTTAGVAGTFVVLRSQKNIVVTGTAINGAGALLGANTYPPPVSGAVSNRAASYRKQPYEILKIMSPNQLQVRGTLAAGDDLTGYTAFASDPRVQYRILRPGSVRVSSQQVSAGDGPGELYYSDVELISYGVGDHFNIPGGTKMVISGSRCRGYRLSCSEQELSYSSTETPWLHLDNYFQTPDVEASSLLDTRVWGSGVKIYYDRSPLVSGVQALLNSRDERDNNQSVLARHLFPHYVSMDISYSGGSLPNSIRPDIVDLMSTRSPKEPLDVSDIIGVMAQHNADHVDTPVLLSVIRHNEDRSRDVLVGNDRVETSRLTGFIPGEINLTRRT